MRVPPTGAKFVTKKNPTLKTHLWVMALLLGSLLGVKIEAADIPHFDQEREKKVELLVREQLYPWFVEQKQDFLEATPRPDGQKISLRAKAILAPGAKANVLILHGFDEEMEKYIELAWDFYQQSYNVFLFDMRGFGFSGRLEDQQKTVYIDRFDAYTEDLERVLRSWIEPQAPSLPFFIFGHSTGGAVAVRFAQRNPQSVKGLVLSSPLLKFKTDPLPQPLAIRIFRIAEALGWGAHLIPGQGKGADYWDFEKSDNTSRPRFDLFYEIMQKPEMKFSELRGPSFRFVREASETLEAMKDPAFRRTLTTPMLVFQASEDSWVPLEEQERFCAEVKSCRFHRVQGARHAIFVEPDTLRVPYLRTIFEFLAAHTQGQKP